MTEATSAATPTHVTTLERRWVFKMLIIITVLVGFAVWAYYDATIAYPARGAQVADSDLRELIRIAQEDGKAGQVSTPDPVSEIARLSDKRSGTALEQAKFQWLTSLSLIGHLTPEYTKIDDPVGRKSQLDAEAAKNPNKANRLSPWDIPAQWAILVVCAGIAIYMIVLYLKVAAVKYRWDENSKTLFLPGDHQIVPTDIVDFDKRKWHKFLITLGIRPDHPTLGGKSITLDLYRYSLLESWVLEMERIVKPESAEPPADQEPPQPSIGAEEPGATPGT